MVQSFNIGQVDMKATFRDLIEKAIMPKVGKAFDAYSVEVLDQANENREFEQFTGHTIDSLSAGVFTEGKMSGFNKIGDTRVVRAKVQKGETVFLKNPIEGHSRAVTGQVDIVQKSRELALNTIKENKPKGGTGFTIATGTEYSEYLESEALGKFDVLSDTVAQVKREGASRMQQLIGQI